MEQEDVTSASPVDEVLIQTISRAMVYDLQTGRAILFPYGYLSLPVVVRAATRGPR